jgi:hypothetical protein
MNSYTMICPVLYARGALILQFPTNVYIFHKINISTFATVRDGRALSIFAFEKP